MFKLYLPLVDTFLKVRYAINKVIIRKEQLGKHSTKNLSFDIFNLCNQLYRSKSTIPKSPKQGKIYFSKNPVLDLFHDSMKALPA